MTLRSSWSSNAWIARSILFLIGLIAVGFVPLLGRYATEGCESGFLAFSCLSWSGTALSVFALGLSLMYLSVKYRHFRIRITDWLSGFSGEVIFNTGGFFVFGTGALVLKDLTIEQCQGVGFSPLCIIHGILDFVFWVGTVFFALVLYLTIAHHPLVRLLFGRKKRRPSARGGLR